MKIVFINRYFYPDHSATSQLLSDLVFYLSAKGSEVHVITSRQRYGDAGAALPVTETIRDVNVHRIWSSRFGRYNLLGRACDYLTFYMSALVFLAWTLKKEDQVISMTDPPMMSVVSAVVARCYGSRTINWIQDLFPETATILKVRGTGGFTDRFLRGLRNWSLSVADLNVVIGRRMMDRLIAEKIKPERIHLIPNWADGEHIRPLAKGSSSLVKDWGVGGKFVFAYWGNMGRAHEFRTVIDAAEKLMGESRLLFLFIGDGPEKIRTEAEFKRRGLNNVLFKPYQPYPLFSESLCIADLQFVSLKPELEGCVLPSKFYAVLAAGRPVIYIGDPEGDIGEVLMRQNCGFTIRPGDHKELSEKIVSLMNDKVLAEKMGRNAREVFDLQFDKHYGLEEWQKILK